MTFKITKPGLYKNRDGDRCEITVVYRESEWPWKYTHKKYGIVTVDNYGIQSYTHCKEHPNDIIGPWEDFRITREGDYRNRRGERVIILRHRLECHVFWPWIQYDSSTSEGYRTFNNLGLMCYDQETLSEYDIIATWEAPQMTNKTKLQERADALQAELDLLKAEISKPNDASALPNQARFGGLYCYS